MNYYLAAFKNYATFTGRARRSEYWYFVLFNMIFAIAAMIIDMIMGSVSGFGFGILYALYLVATIIPSFAVAVRRLHDVGKSGWFYFIVFIPIVGAIWLLVLFFTEGDRGDNQYGSDPKAVEIY